MREHQVNIIDRIRKCLLLEGLPPGRGLRLLQLLLQPPCLPRLSSPRNWIEENILQKLKCLHHIYILGQGKPQVVTLWHSQLSLPRGTPLIQVLIILTDVWQECILNMMTNPVEELDPARDKSPSKGKDQFIHLAGICILELGRVLILNISFHNSPPPWHSGNSSPASLGS